MSEQTDKILKISRWRSMQTTLMVYFLCLALIPMAIVGGIFYQTSSRALTKQAENQLLSVLELKHNGVKRLMDEWRVDILASITTTLVLDVIDLSIAFKSTAPESLRGLYLGKTDLNMAPDGSAYSTVHEALHQGFKNYLKIHGYRNVFLVDMDGNVIYSALKKDIFATNLSTGPYKNTLLAELSQRIKQAPPGRLSLIDGKSHEGHFAIYAGLGIFQGQTNLGGIIYEIPHGKINELMLEREGMGISGETYLVGPDKRMRSDSYLDPKNRSVQASFNGTVSANGVDTVASRKALAGKKDLEVIDDYLGIKVLSAFMPLAVGNVNWAMIAELNSDEALAGAVTLRNNLVLIIGLTGLVVIALAGLVTRRMVRPIKSLTDWSEKIASGDLEVLNIPAPPNEIGVLNQSFRSAVQFLRSSQEEREKQNWLKNGQSDLDDVMRGDHAMAELASKIITFVAQYINAQVGAFYVLDENGSYRLMAGYAFNVRKNITNAYIPGEGLIGQAALEKQRIVVTNVPDDYIAVTSGLGEAHPKHLIVVPALFNNQVIGVFELGKLSELTECIRIF